MDYQTPNRHHLDRRAAKLVDEPGAADDLLTTKELAAWLGTSEQWLEIGRIAGYGPPFVKISSRMVRYKRGAVRRWLKQRARIA
jgi:predicted DNA-binding transcriptional regulator AlpA